MRYISMSGMVLLAAVAACDSSAVGPGVGSPAGTARAAVEASAMGVPGSASGSGHVLYAGAPTPPGLGLRNFAFSAVAHADGSVTGEWQIVVLATILHGPIDCLVIAPDGRSARISGLVADVKPATSSFEENTAFAMELFDNSAGGSGEPDVTTQLLAFRNEDPSVGRDFCESGVVPPGADLNPLPVDHGNFTIRIAP